MYIEFIFMVTSLRLVTYFSLIYVSYNDKDTVALTETMTGSSGFYFHSNLTYHGNGFIFSIRFSISTYE